MPDREKVIKRLKECLSASCRGFSTCPYSDNEWDAVETALALLREQEPVEPITAREGRNKYWSYYVCPNCNDDLNYGQKYCCECGRKVKWDG